MALIQKDILKGIFIDIMKNTGVFEYEDGSPFMIKIKGIEYFVYVKNITSAYFKKLPDITRIQLPYRPHYNRILNSDIPFIILGYDKDNEIFVNWNPLEIKRRLNTKANVSLYSKLSIQNQVVDDLIYETYNVNNDKMLLFKKDLLPVFFDDYREIYGETFEAKPFKLIEPPNSTAKIDIISDLDLLNQVNPLIASNQILKAVEVCGKYYKGKYSEMKFKDWFDLVNKLVEERVKNKL